MRLISLLLFISFCPLAIHSLAPSPAIAGLAPSPYSNTDANGYPLPPAFQPAASAEACPASTYSVYVNQLINQTETQCVSEGVDGDPEIGRFGRNTPFGFQFTDSHTGGCKVYSVTIALQSGVSCTGVAAGGNLTFNGMLLSQTYRFPFVNEYMRNCTCSPVTSPVQVFTFDPGSSYCYGCNNTFSILGSTGSNGLRPIVSQASGGIYAVVIINQWIATSPMNEPRTAFAWVKTPTGNALAVGGFSRNAQVLNSSEEFDPAVGKWTLSTNSLQSVTNLNAAANLQDTRPDASGSFYILNAGGVDQQNNILTTADLYNTSSRSWTPAPPMNFARSRFQLTSIYSGTNAAMATGGLQGFLGEPQALATSEYFDIDTNSWRNVDGNMTQARYRHNAVLLPADGAGIGNILVIGGQDTSGTALNSTELLNLTTLSWSPTGSLNQARYANTATVLLNGSVLVTGGAVRPNAQEDWTNSDLLSSCEIYVNGTWYYAMNMSVPRADHQASILSDGTVLVAGGGGSSAMASSEIWNPNTGEWVTVAPMYIPRVKFGMVTFSNDKTLVFGGATNGSLGMINGTTTSALFSPAYNYTLLAASISPVAAPAVSPAALAVIPSVDAAIAPSLGANAVPAAAAPSDSGAIIVIENNNGISTGAVIGIVAGAVVAAAIAASLIFLCFRLRRRSRQRSVDPSAPSKPSAALVTTNQGAAKHNAEEADHVHSTRHFSFFKRLSVAFSRGRENGEGDLQSLPSKASSVELPKALASPFGLATSPNGKNQGASASQRSIELRQGLPSPFADPVTEPLSTQSTTGKTSTGDPLTGGSWDPNTQNTGSGKDDGFDPSIMGAHQLAGKFSNRSAKSVLISSESSARSELSRVSMTIQNELHTVEWKIDRSTLELGKRLGKGGFGEVFEGTHHGSAVAIKVLEINEDRTMLDACHEFGFLHGLRHSKLVVSYGACVDGNNMLLVMERMEEDLFHAIASNETCARDSVLWHFRGWRIAMDIASALVFLHSKGMIHLDVKSLNILLKGNRTEAKLSDLGLAKLVPDGQLALQNTLPGTPAYSAPEVIQAQLQWRLRTQGRKDQFKTEVGTPADIFAFGVVLFEICTGAHPARWRQDFTGELRPEQAPPSIAKLIDDCLNDDPAERPTASEVLRILLDNRPRHARK